MDPFRNPAFDVLVYQERARETNLGFASVLYDRLMDQIRSFEEDLGPDEELGGYLASFGREVLIRIEHIGYHNPYFVTFEGTILQSGARVRLVQHTSQLGVLLTAVPKAPEHPTPRRIGFSTESSG